MRPGQSVKRP
jgi:hypothetical protein